MYPLRDTPHWMQIAAHFDPVAYAVDLMRYAVLHQHFFSVSLSLGALVLVIAVLAWMSVRVFNRGEDDATLGPSRIRLPR